MTDFEHLLATLEPWIYHYGVAAVFVTLVFESFGLPLPGESLLIVAAILAGRGEISFPGLLLAAWAGAVIGDNVGYLAGRMLGHRLLWRYGPKIGLSAQRLDRVEAIFLRYGAMTVGFARFVGILRQLNGIFAGTMYMDWRRFLAFNALGGAVWVLVWTITGFYLGSHESEITTLAHELRFMAPALAVFVLVAALLLVYGRRALARRGQEPGGKTRDTW